MATLEEALRDPHFIERGLFVHRVGGPSGKTMPALPVPVDPQFRGDPATAKAVPKLGGGR
jgi:crotonobetainyl-CoA:carnitine CoA-transferase CaiB-like acyl-CoA transferase